MRSLAFLGPSSHPPWAVTMDGKKKKNGCHWLMHGQWQYAICVYDSKALKHISLKTTRCRRSTRNPKIDKFTDDGTRYKLFIIFNEKCCFFCHKIWPTNENLCTRFLESFIVERWSETRCVSIQIQIQFSSRRFSFDLLSVEVKLSAPSRDHCRRLFFSWNMVRICLIFVMVHTLWATIITTSTAQHSNNNPFSLQVRILFSIQVFHEIRKFSVLLPLNSAGNRCIASPSRPVGAARVR